MSKAEERALEKYPAYKSVFDKYEKQRYAYICGYIQAEKDNELTWEDINKIEIIIKDVYRDYPHGIEAKQFGIEVLNRFNKLKENKS